MLDHCLYGEGGSSAVANNDIITTQKYNKNNFSWIFIELLLYKNLLRNGISYFLFTRFLCSVCINWQWLIGAFANTGRQQEQKNYTNNTCIQDCAKRTNRCKKQGFKKFPQCNCGWPRNPNKTNAAWTWTRIDLNVILDLSTEKHWVFLQYLA